MLPVVKNSMYLGRPKCAGSPLLSEVNIVFSLLQIRDTSVIFRLLCFGGLKKTLNLNTKERKRFEVYACAMAERNHTLEIWRLLDPEAHLIDHKKLYISSYCIL